jgi:hypothetical protein
VIAGRGVLLGAGAPEAGASEELEVTPAMIEAGVDAYYENAWSGWENPGLAPLREMVRNVFRAMSTCARSV